MPEEDVDGSGLGVEAVPQHARDDNVRHRQLPAFP